MAGDGVLGPFGAADLDDHDRLAGVGGTVQRGDSRVPRLAHGFGEGGDHLGVGVVDQIAIRGGYAPVS